MKIVREHISFERPSSEKDFRDNLLYPEKPFIVLGRYKKDHKYIDYWLPGSDNYAYEIYLDPIKFSYLWYNKEDYFYTTEDIWHFNKPPNWGMELVNANNISYKIIRKKVGFYNTKKIHYIMIPGRYFKWNIKKPT